MPVSVGDGTGMPLPDGIGIGLPFVGMGPHGGGVTPEVAPITAAVWAAPATVLLGLGAGVFVVDGAVPAGLTGLTGPVGPASGLLAGLGALVGVGDGTGVSVGVGEGRIVAVGRAVGPKPKIGSSIWRATP